MLVQGAPYWTQDLKEIPLNSLTYEAKPIIPYQYTLRNIAPHPKQAQWWKRGTHRVYAPLSEPITTVFA
ncbi:hypothetical protein HUJ05_005721 [Dendroctonus ponderosae]|nr:hypothetical protein HUJ05_005721 [Dendroctonus ponderosae]